MPVFPEAVRSSLGKKYVMAVTGLMLLGFVVAHLLGNLMIFAGPEAFNGYAKKLLDLGGLLWIARIILLTAVVLHVVSAVKLSAENRAARPQPYAVKKNVETTYAARTMLMSGIIITAFLIYHLLHFTFRVTNPEISHGLDAKGRHDTYTMVVQSFQIPVISLAYAAAQLFLASHLSHGIGSLFQSLGASDNVWRPRLERGGHLLAWAIFAGYIMIPVSVMLGWVPLHP